MTQPTVTVHGIWLASGAFWLCAEQDRRPLELFRMKSLLFAWHEASFYGTFIETAEVEGKEGVLLPAQQAPDYFLSAPWNRHAVLSWTPGAEAIAFWSQRIASALRENALIPDFAKWQAGGWGWKLVGDSPPSDGEEALPSYWDDWIQLIMLERHPDKDILRHHAERRIRRDIAQPLAKTLALHTSAVNEGKFAAETQSRLPELESLWTDEAEWLAAIGWQQDGAPFRTALRLSEPELSESWSLSVVLQSREQPDLLVACDATGRPARDCPEAWLVYSPRIRQALRRWMAIVPWLSSEPIDGEPAIRTELDYALAWDFLTEKSISLAELGQVVLLPPWWEQLRRAKPRLRAKVHANAGADDESLFGLNGIVRFDWRLAVGDAELSEAEFRHLVEHNRQLVRVKGRWVLLDPAMLQQIRQWMRQVRKKKGLSFRDMLEMHLLASGDGDGEAVGFPFDEDGQPQEALRIEVELNEHLRGFIRRLGQARSEAALHPPASFRGELRHYQLLGSSWLLFLRRFGLGGCLADDMGLGKTIQWITYLLAVNEQERPQTPSLLICPTSVLGNWQKELERFAPSLRVQLHYGPGRAKGDDFPASVAGCDLVLTSYALAHLDESELRRVTWSSICLDEAQNIKNAYTKQSVAIRKLEAAHRIAMTGTPIENRLAELWSIYDFINPGYLGTLRAFNQRFAGAVEKGQNADRIAQLQRLTQPFLLRRVKSDPAIELDLPEKMESKTYVSLSVEQAALYENVIADLFDRLDRLPPMERRGLILATLTKLKQICNHPAAYTKETAGPASQEGRSQKLDRLVAMVRELRQEGDRCLIFTQFVEMGHLLRRAVQEELDEAPLFLHGGVPKEQRDRLIMRFQGGEADCGIFVLSLKAGGSGLNLTAANHVFHFDRWWNPAVENQATDRAFRIGQTKRVQVHKFITLGTLEERIDEMIQRKESLSRQIVGSGEQWITELSTDQLKELFALRREWVGG